jgi:cullin-associated NEDD8-dissociated protein 1
LCNIDSLFSFLFFVYLLVRNRRVAVSILKVSPTSGPAVKEHILQPSLALSTSSLVQDLDSLLTLFRQMVLTGAVEFPELLQMLHERSNDQVSKHGIYNLAKCIATITSTTSTENQQKVLEGQMELLRQTDPLSSSALSSSVARQVQLALLITGDVGRMIDLSQVASTSESLKAIYLRYFESSSEDLKQAASIALGNAAVGSPATFLPTIVEKLDEENRKQQYILLSALREFIQSSFRMSGGEAISSSLPIIMPPLEKHFADNEEGVRTMVAECMGSLAVVQPAIILQRLADMQTSHMSIQAPGGVVGDDDQVSKTNSLVCWTVATSVKQSIAGKVDANELSKHISVYIELLKCEELHVLNAALLMVYSIVHHMPQVIASHFQQSVTPALYKLSELKLERKVDLGPFTHTVDDALSLRKTSLSIYASSLDNLPGTMDIAQFMPVLTKALADAEDIQLHAHQITIGMCTRHPAYLTNSIDTFVDPLGKTMSKKAGQKSGTELERLNDWIKSAVRVMLALNNVEGASNSRKFVEFVERVKADPKFSAIIESLATEN